jgi:hypothetical protein
MNLNRSYKIVLVSLLVSWNFMAVAQTTNAIAPSGYAKFIADRNIFDPNREPNVPWTPRPRTTYIPPVVRQVDSFSLVGIIGYGEGRLAGIYAFFDGTSPDYRKTAQVNDTIANFKITGIAADSVTLMSDTNSETVLRIGEQLHNDGVGHWLTASGTAARYSDAGGGGRNGRNGFGNGGGRRRNNNFGNGNYNARSSNGGNFNRGGNNNAGSAAVSDNSQANDPNVNSQNDNTAPDDNMAPSDGNTAPDTGTQNDTATPQTDQSSPPSGESNDPILRRLQQQRAEELQQTGH